MATIEPVEIELLVRNAELPDPEVVLARFAEHYVESVERARELAARADLGADALFAPADDEDELLDITAMASQVEEEDDVGAFFAAQAAGGEGAASEPPASGPDVGESALGGEADLGEAAAELDAMLAAADEMPALGELGGGDGSTEGGPEGPEALGDDAGGWAAEPAEEPAAELAAEDAWSADQWAVDEPGDEAAGSEGEVPATPDGDGAGWDAERWAAEPTTAEEPQDDGVGFDAPEAAEATPPVQDAEDGEPEDAGFEDTGFGARGPLNDDEDGGDAVDGREDAADTGWSADAWDVDQEPREP